MRHRLLIDAIVRETTLLIAQISTHGGTRAPLGHLADQVFRSLVREIEAQGVGRKVAADMFGLALRSYQLKVQRLEESLWGRLQWWALDATALAPPQRVYLDSSFVKVTLQLACCRELLIARSSCAHTSSRRSRGGRRSSVSQRPH